MPNDETKKSFEEHMEDLKSNLQKALEVEHATIPPYLCALYSIREGTNRAAAAVIQSVVMEEMLHMALVSNLLNAIGGEPRLDYEGFVPVFPAYLPGSDKSFVVPLGKFSREALEVFMRIEKPEPVRAPQHREDEGFSTIGEFYAGLRQHLRELVQEHGENEVFCNPEGRQVTTEYYYGGAGEVFPVTNLESAERAIDEIVEQGEGVHGDVFETGEVRSGSSERADPVAAKPSGVHHTRWSGEEEPAHYYRFMEIYEGRFFQAGDNPKTGPRGPELPVQWDAVYDMQPNPRAGYYPVGSPAREMMDDFNQVYNRLLRGLQAGFNGDLPALVPAVADMYQLKDRAIALMRTPSGDGETTMGPSFEYLAPE